MDTTNIHEAEVNLLFSVALSLFDLPILHYSKTGREFQGVLREKGSFIEMKGGGYQKKTVRAG
jgi:hypothetical protein